METTASTKGQIVIPAELRKKFGIKGGTRLAVYVDEKESAIILKPITKQFIVGLRGIDQGKGLLQALEDERRSDREREERRLGARRETKRKR